MFGVFRGAVAAIALLMYGLPAVAATHKAIYTGYVQRGFDNLRYFGDAPRFDGAAFTATYFFNANVGLQTHFEATWEERRGGTSLWAESPIEDAYVTINGVTHHFDGLWSSIASYRQGDSILHGVSSAPDGFDSLFTLLRHSPFTRLTDTGEYAFDAGQVDGGFAIYDGDNATTASLRPLKVTLAAVPEPSTWIVLILGFGCAGMVQRRKRAMVAASVEARTLSDQCQGPGSGIAPI